VYAAGYVFSRAELRRATRKKRLPRGLGVVRLRADGSRDRRFRPPLPRRPQTAVLALARARGRLYASGAFTTSGRPLRRGLAAFDARTGAPVARFKPGPIAGSVIEAAGQRLLVNRVPGARGGVTLLDLRTGRTKAQFAARGRVCGMAQAAGQLVAGGGFLSFAGEPFENLALAELR
jgi:hypothetical protein